MSIHRRGCTTRGIRQTRKILAKLTWYKKRKRSQEDDDDRRQRDRESPSKRRNTTKPKNQFEDPMSLLFVERT